MNKITKHQVFVWEKSEQKQSENFIKSPLKLKKEKPLKSSVPYVCWSALAIEFDVAMYRQTIIQPIHSTELFNLFNVLCEFISLYGEWEK